MLGVFRKIIQASKEPASTTVHFDRQWEDEVRKSSYDWSTQWDKVYEQCSGIDVISRNGRAMNLVFHNPHFTDGVMSVDDFPVPTELLNAPDKRVVQWLLQAGYPATVAQNTAMMYAARGEEFPFK